MMQLNTLYQIDALQGLKQLKANSIDCIATSPPYWGLRDYGAAGQIGLEHNYQAYLKKLELVFQECKRVLSPSGTLWVNLADSYINSSSRKKSDPETISPGPKGNLLKAQSIERKFHTKPADKSMVGIPQRFSIQMIDDGWILRNTIIWRKPNAMPESSKDRFTNDFEYLLFFTRNKHYYFKQQFEPFESNEYDLKRMRNGRKVYEGKWNIVSNNLKINVQKSFVAGNSEGRNKRSVWDINTKSFKDAHFAVFPEDLIRTPILAGCPPGGVVLDPFIGSGTTAVVAKELGRRFIGFDLNWDYLQIARKRLNPSMQKTPNIFDKDRLKIRITRAALQLNGL